MKKHFKTCKISEFPIPLVNIFNIDSELKTPTAPTIPKPLSLLQRIKSPSKITIFGAASTVLGERDYGQSSAETRNTSHFANTVINKRNYAWNLRGIVYASACSFSSFSRPKPIARIHRIHNAHRPYHHATWKFPEYRIPRSPSGGYTFSKKMRMTAAAASLTLYISHLPSTSRFSQCLLRCKFPAFFLIGSSTRHAQERRFFLMKTPGTRNPLPVHYTPVQ